jgi:hypothetical protein
MGSDPINGWIGLILFLVITPAFYAYMQSGLNAVWEKLEGPEKLDSPDVEPG